MNERLASIIVNTTIFLSTVGILITYCFQEGRWDLKKGRDAFRYFTTLSNALVAISAAGMVIAQLCGEVPEAVRMLKYVGTHAVTVTLLTVLFFLGPSAGYRLMLARSNFYMHLAGPLLAIASYCFLEKRELSFARSLWGLLPVALYGAVYLYKVVYAPKEKRWEDFYGFNRNGHWPISYIAIHLLALAVCALLWRL